jgi:hypothetical protein
METKTKNLPILESVELSMTIAGRCERYAIRKLMQLINCNDKYIFEFFATPDDKKIGYEGLIYVKDKLTNNLLDLYIIEAKVRNTNVTQDELFYEVKKHNTLKKVKQEKLKEGTRFNPKIIYVQFCFDGTHMFFIDDIIESGQMPKITKRKMNAVTVASKDIKENKSVYNLNKSLAVFKKYVFDENEYVEYLKQETKQTIKEINEIKKTTYSIF